MRTAPDPSRHKCPQWFVSGILICLGWAVPSLAGTLMGVMTTFEVTSIGKILERPESFHLQLVQLEGVVRDIEVLKPHDPYQPGDPCFGAYLFSLEDATGTLRIGVLGHRINCGMAVGDEQPEIHEGEQLRVKARIHAPGRYIDKMKGPWPVHHTITQAIAVQITHLEGLR